MPLASRWRFRMGSHRRDIRPTSSRHRRRSRSSRARGSRRSRCKSPERCQARATTNSDRPPRRRRRTAPSRRRCPACPKSVSTPAFRANLARRWPAISSNSSTSSSARTTRRRSGCPTLRSTTTTERRPRRGPGLRSPAGRRLKELEGPHKLALEWREIHEDLEAARVDGDLRELVPELEQRSLTVAEELRVALAPTDPADSKDVIIEIRQGVGGDEAAIWAGDLYRALARYAERRGFKVKQLAASPADSGGFKEVTFAINGDGAYSVFKWEGGTHRVQRVPETESQGRIHTSTATVAVMPEAEEVEVEIDPNDLKIDVYRSTGPGGQSVNTTDSAVRITH